MRGTVFGRLRLGANRLLRDKRGNAMFLTAAAILPVIGLLGSGIDIGRAYMAQLRLQQACDAGVLAGRRAMTGTTYTDAAKAEANKMFNFNFTSNAYGSSGVTFASTAVGTSSVSGTASAELPTALMQVFNFQEFDLAVNCTAKLEISNADVMMVLDVTGSMAQTNSGDSVNRITALKSATMDFFDTLTTADVGDGRLRFGVVPYSSTANVGAILYAKNPAWLSDNVLLPSRTPVFKVTWGNATSEQSAEYTDGNTTYGNYSNVSTVNGQDSTSCENLEAPADTSPTPSGSPNSNQTAQYVDGNGNRITTYDTNQTYTYYNYRYRWSNDRCRLQRRVATFTRTYATTVTETPTQSFDNKYTYQDRVFDVSQAKGGSAIETDTGDAGATVSNTWGGCVMERATEPFGSTQAAPADAHDMDVDSAPTSDDDTKWKVLIPQIAFPRASSPGATPSTTGAVSVSSSNVSSSSSTNGSWQNYSRYWSNGWGVCPVAAMKLTTQTTSDRGSFNTYIQSLQPVGGTYHDAGMVWGVRLLSPDGMFADENATAPNTRPISRHIVFMTDGEMAPNMGNLSFQGYEWLMKRVGGTSDSDLAARHNNRFLQLCERAKAKNITIWVVGFGVTLNSQLNSCATPGKAYQANNATQLNENFQAIARQISKLRLSQ
ncbi:TadE/TadG family type IV pilus assembly protein [Sphingopyxis sp.]|uniref:TadE/TadG family type IV pilus assembly protein n=1 Tax=Sphingopyxis sp. TaxID=1908224 RepID=UPI002FC70CA5